MVRRLALPLFLLLALAGCVSVREVETEPVWTVYVPAVQYDCSWKARQAAYVLAAGACRERVARENIGSGMGLDLTVCETPEPQDYQPMPGCVPAEAE